MKTLQSKVQCFRETDYFIRFIKVTPSALYPNTDVNSYHDFFELEFYLSGAGTMFINSMPYKIKRGFLYMLKPSDYHSCKADPSTPLVMFNLKFIPSMIHEDIHELIYKFNGVTAIDANEKETGELETSLNALCAMFDGELFDAIGLMRARNIIDRIILGVYEKLNCGEGYVPNVNNVKLDMILEHVRENFTSDIDIDALSRKIGVAPGYFSAFFKRGASLCFTDYLNGKRLEYAASLLRETDMTVKEIAYKSGFSSPEYFSRTFKTHYGVSPQKYSSGK